MLWFDEVKIIHEVWAMSPWTGAEVELAALRLRGGHLAGEDGARARPDAAEQVGARVGCSHLHAHFVRAPFA